MASARRQQLVEHAIAAVAEVGYANATLAEIAARAGVSKGVVLYHFAGRDELVDELVAEVFARIAAYVEPRLAAATSARDFVRAYLLAWTGFYADHRREMFAIGDIWTSLRTETGRPLLGPATIEPELARVEAVLEAGQRDGTLGSFDARVVAVSMKGALDALLAQLAADPELDLGAYGAALADLFDTVVAPPPTTKGQHR